MRPPDMFFKKPLDLFDLPELEFGSRSIPTSALERRSLVRGGANPREKELPMPR
jgi:hypothetical protein